VRIIYLYDPGRRVQSDQEDDLAEIGSLLSLVQKAPLSCGVFCLYSSFVLDLYVTKYIVLSSILLNQGLTL